MNTPTIHHPLPLFHEPWWLDAVAPGSWERITVIKDGRIVAALPYSVSSRYGFLEITTPPLTQFLGPWFAPSEGRYVAHLSRQHELLEELIRKVPPCDQFLQAFSPSILNALPFHWSGFELLVQYTYRMNDLGDLNMLWDDIRSNIRTDIRKAQRTVQIRDDLGVDKFIELHKLTYRRQGLDLPYSEELVRRLDAALAARGQCSKRFAVDASGRVHAAVYLAWDSDVCYYLMSGGDPDLRSSGATSFLLWDAICMAGQQGKVFDFEGSMIRPIERIFRAFGAHQTPCITVRKRSRRLSAALIVRDILRTLTKRAV